jgi:hypothetical protein
VPQQRTSGIDLDGDGKPDLPTPDLSLTAPELSLDPTLSLALSPFTFAPTYAVSVDPTLAPTGGASFAPTVAPTGAGILGPTLQPTDITSVSA